MRRAGAAAALLVAVAGCGGGGGARVATHPAGSTTTSTAGTPSVTIGIICTSPSEAAQALVDAWVAGDRAAASRCAAPGAVASIFARPRAAWTLETCVAAGAALATCTFTYPGGGAHLSVAGSDAAGWKVSRVDPRGR